MAKHGRAAIPRRQPTRSISARAGQGAASAAAKSSAIPNAAEGAKSLLHISVETGWPMPRLWPNSRAHRMAVYRAQASATKEAFWATNIVKPRGWKAEGERFKLTIRAHPSVNRDRDDDNLVAACKAFRDGIASALGIDDKLFDLQPVQWGDKQSHGRLYFDVESMP